MLDTFLARIQAMPRDLWVPFAWALGVVVSIVVLSALRKALQSGSWAHFGARFGGLAPRLAAGGGYNGWLVSGNLIKRSLAVFGYFIIGSFIVRLLVYLSSLAYTYITGEPLPFSMGDLVFW